MRRERASWLLWVLGIALLGGAVRLGTVEALLPKTLVGDEIYFYATARSIVEGRGLVSPSRGELAAFPPYEARAFRPPAQSYLLASFFRLYPPRYKGPPGRIQASGLWQLMPLYRVEVALGTLLVALTALLGRALFDPRTGLLSACLAALYPTFIAYSHFLWSETLFAVLATAALIGVVAGGRRPRWWIAAATGAAFGAAGLTRELAGPVALACGLWWIWTAARGERRRAVAHAALMLLVSGLVVLPWTLRNQAVFGRFVPVSTAGWLAFREGNTFEGPSWLRADRDALERFRDRYFAIPGELERSDWAREQTLALIRLEQPTWIFKKAVRTLAMTFSPDSFLFKKISRNAYFVMPMTLVRILLVVTVIAYLAVMLAALPALVADPDPARRRLPALVLGSVLLVHLVANASTRFRVPWMPLLMVYAVYGRSHWRELAARLRGRRLALAASLLAILFGLCVPYFWPDAVSLWTEGTYVEPQRQ